MSTSSNEPALGHISPDIATKLARSLETRADRAVLIERSILKDPNDVRMTIRDRSKTLDGLLEKRPSRDRLQRLNVIKEDDNVAAGLIATRDRLQKAQNKEKLESFLMKRPEHGSLRDRRILVDEKAAATSAARSKLEKLMADRPDVQSLVDKNILPAAASADDNTSDAYVLVPTRVTALADVRVVGAGIGWSYTVVLDDQGRAYSFGSSDNGRLGQGAAAQTASPPRPIPTLSAVRTISVGVNHAAAITSSGELYVWGEGQWGRLGLGRPGDCNEPTRVESVGTDVTAVSSGAYHTLARTATDRVYAFGWNKFGRLGLGDQKILTADTPQEVVALSGRRIKQVCAGWNASAAVTESGELLTWGCGSFGALGHGNEDNLWTPQAVSGLPAVEAVALGEYHLLALTRDGDLYACGRNDYHQLGCDGPGISVPTKIVGGIKSIAAGKQYSLAVTSDGKLLTWGRGSYGVLGHGDQQTQIGPTAVASLSETVRTVSGGVSHSGLCTESGALFTFGNRGANGQLGL